MIYSDDENIFIGASEELKKIVKNLNNDQIYNALAAIITM